jgi:hypothetical protein
MIYISHRGNISGPNRENENNPKYISKALQLGFNVEIDVWKIHDKVYLGHDGPEHQVREDYLRNKNFWCHAKNLDALHWMLDENILCFWHQEDDYTVTSNRFIWTYPLKSVTEKSIIVCKTLEDTLNYSKTNVHGICSDYVGMIK